MKTTKKVKLGVSSGSGQFGSYHYIGRGKGVKVFGEEFASIKALKASSSWADAKREVQLLLKAYKSGITPKCYGLEVIKHDYGNYSVGIVMQHLGYKKLEDVNVYDEYEIIEELEEILYEKTGMLHHDLHQCNVMKYKGKFWIIDFSPDYIEVDNSKVA